MARINNKRVSEKIDYERDIKGKRLIRLSAGVGSGKNYWIGQISRDYPDLRILLITSRINIVNAQAKKLNAQTFIDIEELMTYDEDWGLIGNEDFMRVACTNARIEKFVKHQYEADDATTHIWNNFDLIVVDEVHSLTMDATFTDSPFYVEKFIKQAYKNNRNCDILCMSGTQEPIDWLFSGSISNRIVNIDCFEECIHLEPDNVILCPSFSVIPDLYNYYSSGEKIIFFANQIRSIVNITNELLKLGASVTDFGFSFNYQDEKIEAFHPDIREHLSESIDELNNYLIQNERLPDNIKIFFSTSKNKEGISIENDDIKIMYVESANKNDVVQMAGRVRGNPDTGKGLRNLFIIHDANQNYIARDAFNIELCKNCVKGVNTSFFKLREENKESFNLPSTKKYILNYFKYLRYDNFSESFMVYNGKIAGENQRYYYRYQLKDIAENFNAPFLSYGRTGAEILKEEWFPHSSLYIYIDDTPAEIAKNKLSNYLTSNNLLDRHITREERDNVKQRMVELTSLYDCKELGFNEPLTFDSRPAPALRKFGYKLKTHSNGVYYEINKIR